MNGFRFAVVALCFALTGCRTAPVDLIVRWESPLPFQAFGEKMAVRVDCSQIDGRPSITTTICPEAAINGR